KNVEPAYLAVTCKTHPHRVFHYLSIQFGKGSGMAERNYTHRRVRLTSIQCRVSIEDFAPGQKLRVNLKSDYSCIFFPNRCFHQAKLRIKSPASFLYHCARFFHDAIE